MLFRSHDIAFVEKIDIPGIFGIGAITWVDNLETSNGAIESLPANVVTPIQGMKVYFKGMKSNDQNGVIESTNFGTSMEVNGSVVTFSNMVLSTYKAIKGDSGGPVFWVDPSSTYPKNGSYTLGMQSMSSLGPNGEWLAASRSVFCKRSSIESVGITFNKFW